MARRSEQLSTWCPQCGPAVPVDPDGCCVPCGSTAEGEGAETAVALRELIRTEVVGGGVVFDDARVGYVTVQVGRETWNELRALTGAGEGGGNA